MVSAPHPDTPVSAELLARALATLGESARAAVRTAHDEAYSYASNFVGSAHLLLGLVADTSHRITRALREQGASLPVIRERIEQVSGVRQRASPRFVHLPFSPHARLLLVSASLLAQEAGAPATESDHLWLSLTRSQGLLAERVLSDLGQLELVTRLALALPPD